MPLLLALLAASLAHAQLDRAEAAEAGYDFDGARAAYRTTIDRDPASVDAAFAEARLAWLAARRDPQLGYAPLVVLEHMRRDGVDLERADAELDGLPPGLVRREATFLIAETYLRRVSDPERAIAYYARLVDEGSRDERRAAREAISEAEALETRARMRPAVAIGIFFVLAVALAVARVDRCAPAAALRRGTRPSLVLAASIATFGPTAIATRYDAAVAPTFLALALGASAVLALAIWAAGALELASASRVRRAIVAFAVAASQLAVAYLALDWGGGF